MPSSGHFLKFGSLLHGDPMDVNSSESVINLGKGNMCVGVCFLQIQNSVVRPPWIEPCLRFLVHFGQFGLLLALVVGASATTAGVFFGGSEWGYPWMINTQNETDEHQVGLDSFWPIPNWTRGTCQVHLMSTCSKPITSWFRSSWRGWIHQSQHEDTE